MKKKKLFILDEYMEQSVQRIFAEAYIGLSACLCLSILVKSLLLRLPARDFMVELVLLGAFSVYVPVRMLGKGLDLYLLGFLMGGKQLWLTVTSFTTILSLWNYWTYGSHYKGILDGHFLAVVLFFFVDSFLLFYLPTKLLTIFNQKRQKHLEEELEQD